MRVELSGITKRFAAVEALTDIDLTIDHGSVHGLVGENGAGKSTLGKILAGVIQPDDGELRVNGDGKVRWRNPRDALSHGITIVAQELTLEPKRSIAENVLLGMEPRRRGLIDRKGLNALGAELAREVGFEELAAKPEAEVGLLRVSERQKVEILRALARRAQLIVMDEPTAALPADDVRVFLETIRALRHRGITILYISHRLDEVLAVADAVSILRDGRLVRTGAADEETPGSLVTAMLGRPGDLAFPPKQLPSESAPVLLAARGLTRPPAVNGVDIEIGEGEIVGLAGLIGSGRTEIARLLTGVDRPTGGEIRWDGQVVVFRSPRDAIDQGIALLPESRKDQGLFLSRPVRENVTLSHLVHLSNAGILRRHQEEAEAKQIVDRLAIRPATLKTRVANLSGGNQQRVLFARSLFRRPRLLIVDEPTRGVDVGAKRSIYELIVRLAGEGLGVLLISSEVEEVIGLAHRVLVVREGRIVSELTGDSIEERSVLEAAFATRSGNEMLASNHDGQSG
ncbi:MAG TPA: sugar ABC transporter ATP-binding protein [Acidimicrobiia bacterium]|nr:sugar ABC transporter ATP-binding protein [Acidimicrobiia bacterium]